VSGKPQLAILLVVIDMGNPWVVLGLSVPISVCTHTQEAWVWVLTGFPLGTDMGIVPMDVGTDLFTHYIINTYTSTIFVTGPNDASGIVWAHFTRLHLPSDTLPCVM
jgi:hypothetical protein